ncbi:AzlC family ABC transporter permease [Vibrio sp. WJH972]
MQPSKTQLTSRRTHAWQGVLAMFPLSVAVVPWGFLAGSYAIEAGLSGLEAQAMSAVLFAGAAQLVAAGMFKEEVGLATMLLTTFFITSRHFLYSVSMRRKISGLSGRWRALLGFLLTDELFAVCSGQTESEFNRWYALGAGGSFYIVWNIASFIGIVAGSHIPSLGEYGLDFAVAATFIAIIIPQIKSLPIVFSVLVTMVAASYSSYYHLEGGLMIASLMGIGSGYICELMMKQWKARRFAEGGSK